jgi:hypothetical protein
VRLPVLDEVDLRLRPKHIRDVIHHAQVREDGVAADVVRGIYRPVLKHGHNRVSLIVDVDVLAEVDAVTVDGHWFAVQERIDDPRNKVFLLLSGPVYVAGTSDLVLQAVRVMGCNDHMLCACLASRVGVAWAHGHALRPRNVVLS